ncbi:unnamed protein product, partial [Prorocentrum cordatum]
AARAPPAPPRGAPAMPAPKPARARGRARARGLVLGALAAAAAACACAPLVAAGQAGAPGACGALCWAGAAEAGPVVAAAAAALAVSLLLCGCCAVPMLSSLLRYWGVVFYFWRGGRYADLPEGYGLDALGRAHLYSLASVPWLMVQPHYRAGTFQQDMLTNLRNVAVPTGVYGIPLSLWARSRASAVVAILFMIPTVAFWGSWWRRLRGMEASAAECFRRSLLAPTDWIQLWQLNCRLASMTALATQSKDFDLEDKWKFISSCLEKKIPVTPVMDKPVTLIAKDVNEEGGMGIHVLKNVMHGGRWILQKKLDNCEAVQRLLPDSAPLSTMRVVTGSRGALAAMGASASSAAKARALCSVWRAGRAGSGTDHNCVMFNVPDALTSEVLGSGSSSKHWYCLGTKAWGAPVSTMDGSISAHPDTDTGRTLAGERLPGASAAAALCERAHDALMPGVPLAGWDVAFCPPGSGGGGARGAGEVELVLLEANLSCNFFRGKIEWGDYAALADEHFAAIDAWRRRRRGVG